jgi:hypothetical protein
MIQFLCSDNYHLRDKKTLVNSTHITNILSRIGTIGFKAFIGRAENVEVNNNAIS